MKEDDTKPFVLDASIVLAWCFEDKKSKYADGVLELLGEGEAIVPAIWPLEVTNALLSAMRKRRLTQAQASGFLNRLSGFSITVEEPVLSRAFEGAFLQAVTSELTSYDASYLELAARRGLSLASLDDQLVSAAKSMGIPMTSIIPLPEKKPQH